MKDNSHVLSSYGQNPDLPTTIHHEPWWPGDVVEGVFSTCRGLLKSYASSVWEPCHCSTHDHFKPIYLSPYLPTYLPN